MVHELHALASGRFWHLQWAGTGLYLAVSALLAALSFWWTRRRLS